MNDMELHDFAVSDYVAQSAKWCAEFNIQEDFPYDLKVELADRALFDAGDKYDEIAEEAEAWLEKERERREEALPKYNATADFIVQSEQWSKEFNIPAFLPYTEKVKLAEEVLRTIEREKYAALFAAAEEWSPKQAGRGEQPFDTWEEQLRRQLLQIRTGKYLMIYLPYHTTSFTIEQGELKSIDWHNGSVLLRNTVYDRDVTVWINNIQSVDESRSGSGALGAVQSADLRRVGSDWYRGNQKL